MEGVGLGKFLRQQEKQKRERDTKALPEKLFNVLRQVLVFEPREVLKKFRPIKIPPGLAIDTIPQVDLIKNVIKHLKQLESPNVLTHGYSYEDGVLNCFQVNVCVEEAISPAFCDLRRLIGTARFVNLLVNTIGFKNNVQIFGPYTLKVSKSRDDSHVFSNRSVMLGHPVHEVAQLILGVTGDELLCSIFDLKLGSSIPKNFRKARHLCHIITRNNNGCKYGTLIHEHCPDNDYDPTTMSSNFEVASSRRRVVKFVLTLFEKLFPEEIWGNSHNKVVLYSGISHFINMAMNESLTVSSIMKSVQLRYIKWLGGGKDRQGARCIRRRFEKFVTFLFGTFLKLLLRHFFYITENPRGFGLMFFRHRLWRNITKSFKEKYFGYYLSPKFGDSGKHPSPTAGSAGIMRVVPKESGFRVLCRLQALDSFAEIKQRARNKFEIEPVSTVLRRLRPKSAIFSVQDVFKRISEYRHHLLEKNKGNLPVIYALKFDASNCYDSIPRAKIIAAASTALNRQSIYVTKRFNISRNLEKYFKGLYKRRIFQPKLSGAGHIFKMRGRFGQDLAVTSTYTKEKVLNIIRQQMGLSTVFFEKNQFVRVRGIFQGLKLSSEFCDLVYDEYVEKYLQFNGEALTLRLSDDFLILSPHLSLIQKVSDSLSSAQTREYNIIVNQSKTMLADLNLRTLNFCGLTIDLNSLSAYKTVEQYGKVRASAKSESELYEKCLQSIRLKLYKSLLSLKYNSQSEVERNVRNAIMGTLAMLKCSLEVVDHPSFNEHVFIKKFYLPAIELVNQLVMGVNGRCPFDVSAMLNKATKTALAS